MNVQMKNPWQIGRAIFRQTTHPKLTARNEGKRGHDKARSHMRSANSTMGPQVPGFRSSAWHSPPVHVHNCGEIPAVVPASFTDPAPGSRALDGTDDVCTSGRISLSYPHQPGVLCRGSSLDTGSVSFRVAAVPPQSFASVVWPADSQNGNATNAEQN